MSSLTVTVERLTIHEHPNADALELAQVGLYRAVVGKGIYRTGDYAIYIPEQAVLPPTLIEELGLTGRLAGKDKDRVKAIRLRGELSQGIVCRPGALARLWDSADTWDDEPVLLDPDYAEELGISKWVPPIPVGMAGQVEPAPDLIRWIDIENIKRYPDIFAPGEEVVATEKIHGSACLFSYIAVAGGERLLVSSKGVGSQQLAITEAPGNLYWRAVRANNSNLVYAAARICGHLDATRIGLFGEVYGAGVQDLYYGANAAYDETLGYAVFDIAVDHGDGAVQWLSHDEIDEVCKAVEAATPAVVVPRVPVLYRGPYDYERLAALAEGRSLLDAGTIREGLVVRPAVERRSELLGGRAIGKIVSEGYLLRGGNATEFE